MFGLAILCFMFSLNLAWTTTVYANNSRAALHWPVVDGIVQYNNMRRGIRYFYNYSVNGNYYYGDLFELPNPIPFSVTKMRYRDGHHILVYYDPAEPSSSAVNRMLDENKVRLNYVCSLIAALAGVIIFSGYVNALTDKSLLR